MYPCIPPHPGEKHPCKLVFSLRIQYACLQIFPGSNWTQKEHPIEGCVTDYARHYLPEHQVKHSIQHCLTSTLQNYTWQFSENGQKISFIYMLIPKSLYPKFIQSYRPIRNMAATNQHKLIFIKQTNEPIREKEHVDISDTAKFQSSGPNAGEMADIWLDPLPYICLLFSGFSNVCHSAAFWPTALKLGCITNAEGVKWGVKYPGSLFERCIQFLSMDHQTMESVTKQYCRY